MGLLNVYSFNKTIKPHIAYRFKVTFFYNKGAEEIESLTYYVKSVELPIWNMNTENRQRFGNTQYVIPIFDFGQSTLKIVFMETDKMSVTYFLNGFLFNNIENADMEANLWNNCAPKIIKIKIDELDQSMRNTVVSNIYACHLKRLSSPNFSNLNFGNPIEVEAEFVVRYKLNSIAEEIGEVHSSLPDPETFKDDILNSRTQEEYNKNAATIHQNKANALTTQRPLTQSELNAIQMNLSERLSQAQSLGLNSNNEEYASIEKQLDLFKKRSELIKNNGSVDEILEIDRQLASVNTLNVTGASSSNGDTGLLVSKIEEMKSISKSEGLVYGHQDYVDTTSMEFKDRSWNGDKTKGIDCSGFATPILAAVDKSIMNYATDKKRLNTREIQKYMIEHPELYEEVEVEEGMELKRGDIALRATTTGGSGKDQNRDHILFIDQDVSSLSTKTVVKTAEFTGDSKNQVQGEYVRSGNYIINGSSKGGKYKIYRLRKQA